MADDCRAKRIFIASVDVNHQDVNADRNDGKAAHRRKIACSVWSMRFGLLGC